MSLFSFSGANSERPSMLPTLLGILLAIVFWMLAQDARDTLPRIELQIDAAARTANRAENSDEAGSLQARLAVAQAEKASLESRLRTADSAQMVRAKMVYDLRQKCAASGATACNVRLADDTIAAPTTAGSPAAAGARKDEKIRLIDLGVQKARAVISGSFQNNELVDLSRQLDSDPDAYWRINGVAVRGSTFELDVERHIITAAGKGS